jgi:hypothetical protein
MTLANAAARLTPANGRRLTAAYESGQQRNLVRSAHSADREPSTEWIICAQPHCGLIPESADRIRQGAAMSTRPLGGMTALRSAGQTAIVGG